MESTTGDVQQFQVKKIIEIKEFERNLVYKITVCL